MDSKDRTEVNCNCIICKIKYRNSSWKRGLKDWDDNDGKAIGALFIFLILWFSFEQKFLYWIEEFCVNNIFHGYEHRAFSFMIVGGIITYYVIIKLPSLFLKYYFTPYRYLILPLLFVVAYYYYRINNYYPVQYQYFGICLLDVLVFLVGIYVLFAVIFNNTNNLGSEFKPDEEDFKFYHDRPLDINGKDELGFAYTAEVFFKRIKSTLAERTESISIGVNGVWGEGKSSFMYLLITHFKKEDNDFIVLEFNPRHAKSKESIQIEFFQLLYDELKEYDMRFSNSFNNYLKAINVIDSNGLFDFLKIGHEAVFDKEDEKNKINKALSRINKRVVVFIDDLDRLVSDEIIEVFKLIDGNASFNNMLFITAYDREYVNKVFEKYKHGTGYFIDKFFTIEKPLPYIARASYIEYLINELKSSFKDQLLDAEYDAIRSFAEKNLNTLRDCKRFLNRFIDDYKFKSQNVAFKDFFILSLIEYRWINYYQAIRTMQIVEIGNAFTGSATNTDQNTIYIKNDWLEILKSSKSNCLEESVMEKAICVDKTFEDLFKELFYKTRTPLSINNKIMFNNYFMPYVNEFANPFIIEEMFTKTIQENRSIIDEIFLHKQEAYITNYLAEKQVEFIKDEKIFYNYIDVLFYTFLKSNDYYLRVSIVELLLNKTVEQLIKTNLIQDENQYKEMLREKIIGQYPSYLNSFTYRLLLEEVRETLDNKDYVSTTIFDKSELLNINKLILKDLIKQEQIFNQKHLEILYTCITHITSDATRTIMLDRDACKRVKQLIIKNPTEYFKNFVKLFEISTSVQSNKISCEPFWNQIFDNKSKFKAFISDSKFDNFENIETVRNFWKLFKNNKYKPINFNGRGNVQERINNGLIEENTQLSKIINFKAKFIAIERQISSVLTAIEKSKKGRFIHSNDFEQYILENDFDYKVFLEGLVKINELINELNVKDGQGNDVYWLDIETLKDLKFYEVRKLNLYDVGSLPEIIQTVRESIKRKEN